MTPREAPEDVVRRPYRSARRRQQAAETRSLVLAAATALFAERGWSGTGMREVARQAGVATETVYAGFGSKTDLLLAAIDVGVVGDDAPVPLSQRPEFAELGAGGFEHRIAHAARLVRDVNQRSWGLHRAIREAAVSEPQLAATLRALEESRRLDIRQGAEMVVARPVDDDELDALWALTGDEVFSLLTRVGGRSVDDYERWLAHTLSRVLGDPNTGGRG